MEASTIPATAVLAPQRARVAAGPLLRLRSDEQLVRLFRAGNDEAFRAIHDRYRARLFAYTRQMLAGSRPDAEDALQDVFVRAYAALRANDRAISLRAWLYRVAHNRCIDELRRPAPPSPETLELIRPPTNDPIAATEQRESLCRLVADVRRLPEQQRSALLMREIVGLSYQDLAVALEVTVPAVKSLLVRARVGLAQAAEARDTACVEIRRELADAHERGVRASALARRHLHDCAGCREYRGELRALRERFAALTPTLGPGALLAKLLGLGGGGAAASSGAGAGGAATVSAGTALGGGAVGVSASHVAAVVAVAVVGAGGAVEMQQTLVPHHHAHGAHPAPALVRPYVPAASAAVPTAPALPGVHVRHSVAANVHKAPLGGALKPLAPVTTPPPVATTVPSGPSNGGAALPPELADTPPAADPGAPSTAPSDPGGTTGDGGTTPSPTTGGDPSPQPTASADTGAAAPGGATGSAGNTTPASTAAPR